MPLFTPDQLAQYLAQLQTQNDPQTAAAAAPQADPRSTFRKVGIPAILGGALGDGLSTNYALSHNPNAQEANPLMAGLAGHPAGLLAAKLALGGGESFALDQLAKTHPKLATGLGIGIGALGGGLTLNNLRAAKK